MGIQSFLRESNFSTEIDPDGLRQLGWGISRIAFEIQMGELQGKVLKMARQNSTIHENKHEIEVWKHVRGTTVEKYFCPIDLPNSDTQNYRYIVMEYAQQHNTQKGEEMAEEVREATDVNPVDIGGRNIGFYNGNPVFIDYPWGVN